MICFLVLIACFTPIYTFQECLLKDPHNKCCIEAIEKIQKFMNDSGGIITFTKEKFVFEPSQDWVIFAKKIIQNKESETLKDMKTSEVEEYFKIAKDYLSPLTLLSIRADAKGPDLLTQRGRDWKFTNPEVVGSGDFQLEEGTRPVLGSKKANLFFEFNLGDKYWETSTVSKETCSEFEKVSRCSVNIGDGVMEIEKTDKSQRLSFKIMVYHVKAKRRTNRNQRKALNLIRGMAEVLSGRLQNMKPEEHLGLPYRYSSKQESVHLEAAYDTMFYIRRWIKPKNCSYVVVDMDKLMKAYLKKSDVTYIYDGAVHSPMEFKAKDKEQHILFVDKFMHSDLSGYPRNYANKGKKNPKMMDIIQDRLKIVSKKVDAENVDEMNALKLKNFVVRKLLQPYFEKTRKETTMEKRDVRKYQNDKYFAGREETGFKPYFRKLGPPYGIKKAYLSNQPVPEPPCTEEPPFPEEETPCTDGHDEVPPEPEYLEGSEDECTDFPQVPEPPCTDEMPDYPESDEVPPEPEYLEGSEDECTDFPQVPEPPCTDEMPDYPESDEATGFRRFTGYRHHRN